MEKNFSEDEINEFKKNDCMKLVRLNVVKDNINKADVENLPSNKILINAT